MRSHFANNFSGAMVMMLSSCVQTQGLFLCMWKIFNSPVSGIYVEVEFLDSVFNYGQVSHVQDLKFFLPAYCIGANGPEA